MVLRAFKASKVTKLPISIDCLEINYNLAWGGLISLLPLNTSSLFCIQCNICTPFRMILNFVPDMDHAGPVSTDTFNARTRTMNACDKLYECAMRPINYVRKMFKYHFYRWYMNVPVQVLLKLYQFTMLGLLIWRSHECYDVMAQVLNNMIYTYMFLNLLLFGLQTIREGRKPSQSADLVNVMVILAASVRSLIGHTLLPCIYCLRS